MRVKICGITNVQDGLTALKLGADMLGFNFYRNSKRYVSLQRFEEIDMGLRNYPGFFVKVGVFVNATYEDICLIVNKHDIDLIQLSGDEPPALLYKLGRHSLKVLRPRTYKEAVEMTKLYPKRADPPAFLIDSFSPGVYGGIGKTGDWELMRRLAEDTEILIAGGLTINNVESAIKYIKPWGVDVASGVEFSPGIKDAGKIKTFIDRARSFTL